MKMATASIRSKSTSLRSTRKAELKRKQMLTQASNLKEAIEVLEKGMKGTLANYEIASVTETALMDIFPYDAEDDKNTDKTADANNPSVRKFFQSLPEGCKTEITVSGKKIIVDKTGRDTVVTPMDEG